jgi:DNA-binding LacI/PurR family transcriptional regulator
MHLGKKITISDIALRAGVAKSTVSFVLNEKGTQVPISEVTRKKVLKAVHECGYQPNAAARALSTRRTGQIGFILSDRVADGLANVYYANCLAGIEKACRERGYGLNISLYNLSNLDSFVFPKKVGQRAVDGLILADYAQAGVLAKFKEFDIPFVCIGDDLEQEEKVAAVVSDCFGYMRMALRYLVRLGHRRVGLHTPMRRRAEEYAEEFIRQASNDEQCRDCRVTILRTPDIGADYTSAGPLMEAWLALEEKDRSTAIYGNYQTILAFLKELNRRGFKCPRDVSLFSGLDTPFCGLTEPGITSVRQDMAGLGQMAANLLIDHVENVRPLALKIYQSEFPGELIERESCGPPVN